MHRQIVVDKMLQYFLVQNICASSISFVEDNIWIEKGFTHLQNPRRFFSRYIRRNFAWNSAKLTGQQKSFQEIYETFGVCMTQNFYFVETIFVFDTKYSCNMIAENLHEFCKCMNLCFFLFSFQIYFRNYSSFSLFFFTFRY